jgi:hypothetical protein
MGRWKIVVCFFQYAITPGEQSKGKRLPFLVPGAWRELVEKVLFVGYFHE